jgi:hypothetical protein
MGFGFLDVVKLCDENYSIAADALGVISDEILNTPHGPVAADKLHQRVSLIAAAQTKRDCIALHGRQAGTKAWSDAWSALQRNDLGKSMKQGRRKTNAASRDSFSASGKRIQTVR